MHAPTLHGKGPVWTQIVRLSSARSPVPSLANTAGEAWEREEPFPPLKPTSSPVHFAAAIEPPLHCPLALPETPKT